ncbi:hypothetical protein OGAPHI_006614 [Ogataea philodendri]|uniref:Uncharacterized protein n=1 Tax=Ogataea philodendri TaxID=1378263 RepID=A0A9P8NXF9_9ASCO|nr:uncharacterized protein OGAPHI_006614 [Ogataea philodendri]KAH3661207.1 hypothetical protein OGAPHI_006614 [Ogataea philodendri]
MDLLSLLRILESNGLADTTVASTTPLVQLQVLGQNGNNLLSGVLRKSRVGQNLSKFRVLGDGGVQLLDRLERLLNGRVFGRCGEQCGGVGAVKTKQLNWRLNWGGRCQSSHKLTGCKHELDSVNRCVFLGV